jgi:acetyl esterase/lipase
LFLEAPFQFSPLLMMPKPVVLHDVPRAAATLLRKALPAVLIQVGEHESLAYDAAILTEVLVGHGVSVRPEI